MLTKIIYIILNHGDNSFSIPVLLLKISTAPTNVNRRAIEANSFRDAMKKWVKFVPT